MNKRVLLTWVPDDGRQKGTQVVEEVLLLDEDVPLYSTENQLLGKVSDLVKISPEYVLFEDEDGIFGLHPNQIISIEIL